MIGILNAYHVELTPAEYQLEYGGIFVDFVKATLPDEEIRVYKTGLGELPTSIDECDGWIITGSAKSVFQEEEWIKNLGEFVRDLHKNKKKLVGLCFGHQLIAHFLGGETQRSNKGWGVGVRQFEVTSHKPWMTPMISECALIFSHQDQVIKLPSGAELLGQDDFCPNQMYSIENHIFCMQGHPEFTPSFARGRLDARVSLIGQPTYDKAVESLTKPTDAKVVSQWLRQFFSIMTK